MFDVINSWHQMGQTVACYIKIAAFLRIGICIGASAVGAHNAPYGVSE